jgi:hypothetical protein
MKKYLMTVVAALAAASFTSCSNEMDMFDPISSDMATIDLNVTNDNVMLTRASSAISANDYANWFFQVSPKTVTINDKTTDAGETVATGFNAASTIGDYKFKAGGYSVDVRNYATESDAYKANDNKGDAFYTGSVDKTLTKGNNAVEVDCGQAQNCRVKVNLTGLNDLSAISNPSITLTQSERGVACPALVNGETGYFMVGKPISYVLNYKYFGLACIFLNLICNYSRDCRQYDLQLKILVDSSKNVITNINFYFYYLPQYVRYFHTIYIALLFPNLQDQK